MKKVVISVVALMVIGGCQFMPSKQADLDKIAELEKALSFTEKIETCLKDAKNKFDAQEVLLKVMYPPIENPSQVRDSVRKGTYEYPKETLDLLLESGNQQAIDTIFSDINFAKDSKLNKDTYQKAKEECYKLYSK